MEILRQSRPDHVLRIEEGIWFFALEIALNVETLSGMSLGVWMIRMLKAGQTELVFFFM